MDYNLELDRVAREIKKAKAKTVCLQLPDGLKPKAKEIQDYIEKQTKASVIIWAGSCFGACDIPHEVNRLGVDLLLQWGHAPFKK